MRITLGTVYSIQTISKSKQVQLCKFKFDAKLMFGLLFRKSIQNSMNYISNGYRFKDLLNTGLEMK